MRRYWLYKNNIDGGPAQYWGDWESQVFDPGVRVQWGGSYSTKSYEVLRALDERVSPGDIVVAYQTDKRSIIGFCVIARIEGPPGDRRLWLDPIYTLPAPFSIHEHKRGTLLEASPAVKGPVMLRELTKAEMSCLFDLAAVPKWVMTGTRPK